MDLHSLLSVHRNVVCILLVTLNTDRVSSGTARAENSRVIRADDEMVSRRVCEILSKGSCLIDVVSFWGKRRSELYSTSWEPILDTYTRP